MFKTILIANRGEIACRIMATARLLGIRCVAVYSDADAQALHVVLADEAFRIGPAPASESYLRIDAIIAAAKRAGAEAIHPGYGFLSEKAEFVEACEAAGIVFIGPPAAAMRAMGLKDAAKALMQKAGVPVVPGYHGGNGDLKFLAAQAREIGYPVLVKAAAGGGGKGMRRVDKPAQLAAALETASSEAKASFGDGSILIEKFITKARHIEIQVFADGHGNAVSLFERDCSLQRRHQKVIEEAPAPGVSEEMRRVMGEAAVKAARAVDYRGAGTIEFIADISDGLRADRFYFMEMNTRLQVEHPVTEAITGLDLVEWQLRVAAGEPLPLRQDQLGIVGHAFEARIYAEDPKRGFMPSLGRLNYLRFPDGVRVDSGVVEGCEITPYYDPMIAKVIVHGQNRASALSALATALGETRAMGCATNIAFLKALAAHRDVVSGAVSTDLIEREVASLTIEPEVCDDVIAMAALGHLGFLRDAACGDPWTALRGWRAWGESRTHFRFLSGERVIEGCVAAIGGRDFRIDLPKRSVDCAIAPSEGDAMGFVIAGRRIKAVVKVAPDAIGIFTGGQSYAFERPGPGEAHDDQPVASGRVVSPMTGLVKVVAAKAGTRVARGDVLAVIEAMKLEHSITATLDGTVGEVFVRSGDQVQEGQELLRFAEVARDG